VYPRLKAGDRLGFEGDTGIPRGAVGMSCGGSYGRIVGERRVDWACEGAGG
jgi:hypothetical protein